MQNLFRYMVSLSDDPVTMSEFSRPISRCPAMNEESRHEELFAYVTTILRKQPGMAADFTADFLELMKKYRMHTYNVNF